MATAWEVLTANSTVTNTTAAQHLLNQDATTNNGGPDLQGATVLGVGTWGTELTALSTDGGAARLSTHDAVVTLEASDALHTLEVDATNAPYNFDA